MRLLVAACLATLVTVPLATASAQSYGNAGFQRGSYGNAGDHAGAYGNGQASGGTSYPNLTAAQQQYLEQQYLQQQYLQQQYLQQQYLQQQYLQQQYLQQQYLQQQYLQQQAAQEPAADVVPVQCRVVSIQDGDTLRVLDASGNEHKVRLQGIDAPETNQAFGTKSRNRLAELTMGNVVSIYPLGIDKYRRTLGTIEVEGQDVNQRMVAEGLAWHYAQFDKSPALAAAQREAKAAGRGLWADKAPVPPWEWRASEKDRKGEAAAR